MLTNLTPVTKESVRQAHVTDVVSLTCINFTRYKGDRETGMHVTDAISLTCLTITGYKGEREISM